MEFVLVTQEYKEYVGKDGITFIKCGKLQQIVTHLIGFLTSPVDEQKAAGSKMFLAFIHSYRRVETGSNVLAVLHDEYFNSLNDVAEPLSLSGGTTVSSPNLSASPSEKKKSKKSSSERRYSSSGTDKKAEVHKRKQGLLAFMCLWLEHRFVPDFTTPYVDGQSKKTPLYGELLQFFSKMQPGQQSCSLLAFRVLQLAIRFF